MRPTLVRLIALLLVATAGTAAAHPPPPPDEETHVTGALAFGYRCPWRLRGPYDRATRYMIGVRLVASATRSVADPDDWSMSVGLEFEPLGSLRYVGGIKSWY